MNNKLFKSIVVAFICFAIFWIGYVILTCTKSHNELPCQKVYIESVHVDSVVHYKDSFDAIPTKEYDMYHYSIKLIDEQGDTITGTSITKMSNLDKWVGDTVEIRHGQLKIF